MKRRMEMRAEMDKLTMRQRIDKMHAMRAERDATMDKRADAVQGNAYTVLTPYQKGVFDAHAAPGHGRNSRHSGAPGLDSP